MFESNFTLFMERFPQTALQIPSAPAQKKAVACAELAPLKEAEALYFIGIGKGEGYLFSKPWLKEQPSRRLILLEEDLSEIRRFLELEEAHEILSDKQVIVSTFSEIDTLVVIVPWKALSCCSC